MTNSQIRNEIKINFQVGNDIRTNNRSGFAGLPGGHRNTSGEFMHYKSNSAWWTSTEVDSSLAFGKNIRSYSVDLDSGSYYRSCGFSVRLVKD